MTRNKNYFTFRREFFPAEITSKRSSVLPSMRRQLRHCQKSFGAMFTLVGFHFTAICRSMQNFMFRLIQHMRFLIVINGLTSLNSVVVCFCLFGDLILISILNYWFQYFTLDVDGAAYSKEYFQKYSRIRQRPDQWPLYLSSISILITILSILIFKYWYFLFQKCTEILTLQYCFSHQYFSIYF